MAPFRSFFQVIEFGNFVVRGLKQKQARLRSNNISSGRVISRDMYL